MSSLDTLFHEAADLSKAERERYLSELRVRDAALCAQLERLLDADATDDDFLSVAAVERTLPTIEGYELLGTLGEGGMGVVFEARQLEPERHVAIKALRHAFASPSLHKRFLSETRVLASLKHAAIAQIYAVGSFEAVGGSSPFFAMELVSDARTLDAYVHEARPTQREVLELFCTIADGVQHGHERGVVHRDLKPGNVLVARDAQLKIIDFGIARTLDDTDGATLLTLPGQVVGTPQYMSPEALEAQAVDARSDVYSLGAMLYELLCGRAPFRYEHANWTQFRRDVVARAPQRPSSLEPRLRGDLEAIVLKALSKVPQHRYVDAGAFAEDLRRFARREAISARPPSTLTSCASRSSATAP